MSTIIIVSSNKIDITRRKCALIIKVYLKSPDSGFFYTIRDTILNIYSGGGSPVRAHDGPLEVGLPKIIALDPSLLFGLVNKVGPLVCLRYSVFNTNGFTTAIHSVTLRPSVIVILSI